ncbi:GH25 family lysozyme [Streptomyces sp. NBC_01190]|uniref:GH25 family lysozyme n=1 Tax=Streptomyces sp. NBC_01190 TaxID=2903767 RepID=UPI00386C5FEB|nr:GH25 family lysozyme [Streptomyces sp. NBC_01190]
MNRTLATAVTLGLTVLGASAGLPHDVARAAAIPAPAHPWHEDADHMGSGLTARMPARAVHESVTAPAAPDVTGTLKGLDVSAFQENINWPSVASKGASFAYVKATEGTDYTSSQFSQQYNGSAAAGLIRGAYHFALPNTAGGSAQADYFVAHGGGWSDDGKTLPGALDIEYNPYGATCYGLSQSAMVSWITAFSNEYHAKTGRYPIVYSTRDWWSTCTGNSATPGQHDPLWIANYSGSPTPLPAGWSTYTIWQNADSGTFPGDQDVFNGTTTDLKTFAHGTYAPPPPPPGSGWPVISQGATGHSTTTIQYLLDAHGSTLTVDGDFGPATRSAVIAFQTSQGLTADGIVGPSTWQVLIITVQEGDGGPAVKAAQDELTAHSHPVTVDGEFGPATRSGVLAFQTSKSLTADGVVGPKTWAALVS